VLGLGKGKLLREGAEIQGVVVDVKRQLVEGGNYGDPYHVTVRVNFPDGSTAETKQKLGSFKTGNHFDGAIVPVRYDAEDHSKIEVDVPALEAQQTARIAEAETRRKDMIARSEATAAGGAPPQPAGAQDVAAPDLAASTANFTETMAAIKQARADGNLAEVDRLKAEFASRQPK
jgi:hypothetical protein